MFEASSPFGRRTTQSNAVMRTPTESGGMLGQFDLSAAVAALRAQYPDLPDETLRTMANQQIKRSQTAFSQGLNETQPAQSTFNGPSQNGPGQRLF